VNTNSQLQAVCGAPPRTAPPCVDTTASDKYGANYGSWTQLERFCETVISDFLRDVDENCSPLGYSAAYSGNSLPTFRDNLSIPSSSVKNLRTDLQLLNYTRVGSILNSRINMKHSDPVSLYNYQPLIMSYVDITINR